MDDCRLIQNKSGEVCRFIGTEPPDSWRWMPRDVGACRILGDWVPGMGTGEKLVPCEVYTRVAGFLRPVSAFNVGKKQEFAERQTYSVEKALLHVGAN